MAAFHVFPAEDRSLFRAAVRADMRLGPAPAGPSPKGLEALPYYFDTHPGWSLAMARRVIRATLKAQEARPA
jgi:hypothetical protein